MAFHRFIIVLTRTLLEPTNSDPLIGQLVFDLIFGIGWVIKKNADGYTYLLEFIKSENNPHYLTKQVVKNLIHNLERVKNDDDFRRRYAGN